MSTCGKQAYSKRDAQTAANIRTKGRQEIRRHRPNFLRIYHCDHCDLCNFWHLTHQRKHTPES